MTEIRRHYQPERVRSLLRFRDEAGEHDGLTEQHHKDKCQVRNILAQYDRTGIIQHANSGQPQYGDFTGVEEYQESLNKVLRAQKSFEALPADIRRQFGNDPSTFLEFATNPKNQDRLVEMGLAFQQPEPEETAAEASKQQAAEPSDQNPT